MTTPEKMDWVRENWWPLRKQKRLIPAVSKVVADDEFLNGNLSASDVIFIEELFSDYLI